jgi:hypothetical protein
MFRHFEEANLQECLLNFELSVECSVIKYKIFFHVISFISIIHTKCPLNVTVQNLRMFFNTSLLYLERYNLVCELHILVVIIAGESMSPNAFSLPS